MRSFPKIVLLMVACILVGVVVTLGYLQFQAGVVAEPGLAAAATPDNPASGAASAQAPTARALYDEDILVGIYERVSPAVVFITSNAQLSVGDFPDQEIPLGTGSGFLIDADGHILTNNHVVADAKRLDVTFADGTTVDGKVLGRDPASDLAVMKVDIPPDLLQSGKVAVATLGDSDRVRVGQMAVAIGNPFGFERTMTVGVISGLGRDIPAESRAIRGGIQTDAAINPGNSGGPLLNAAGEVIGINSAIESPVRGSVGVGFAVPVNTAKRYLDDMIAGRPVAHPWLGIVGYQVTQKMAEQLGLSVAKGVYVLQVSPGSPAEKAGLRGAVQPGRRLPGDLQLGDLPKGGDVITAIDGQTVTSASQIGAYLEAKKLVGDTVNLSVRRGAEELSLQATLAAWPAD